MTNNILTDQERSFLQGLLGQTRHPVSALRRSNIPGKFGREQLEQKTVNKDLVQWRTLATFDSGECYTGMELDKDYTLTELGITNNFYEAFE